MRRRGSYKIKMMSNLPMRDILRFKRGSRLIEEDTGETLVDILVEENAGARCEAAEAKALEAESAIDIEGHYSKEPGSADVKEPAYTDVKELAYTEVKEPVYTEVKKPAVYADVKGSDYDDVKVSTYAEVKEK